MIVITHINKIYICAIYVLRNLVCHGRYVRVDKAGTALAHVCEVRFVESRPGRIYAHTTGFIRAGGDLSKPHLMLLGLG